MTFPQVAAYLAAGRRLHGQGTGQAEARQFRSLAEAHAAHRRRQMSA